MLTKKIIIHVTAKDIREGVRAECRRCPIARALSRRLNRSVRVFTQTFDYFRPRAGWSIKHPLPERASDFIALFDMEQEVRPTRFTITVPR